MRRHRNAKIIATLGPARDGGRPPTTLNLFSISGATCAKGALRWNLLNPVT
jgi:hypothetical protein